jgi:glycosyltransferase involved in cell wall biosynthesis
VFKLKKVLIITYYFPPNPAIGGVRLFGLAKYLSLYGWNPIILTPVLPGVPDPKMCIIQTPYYDIVENWKRRVGLNPKKTLNKQLSIKRKKDQPSFIERLTVLPYEIIIYPDDKIGWYDFAVMAGEKILQTEQIDAILSSSRPETCHLIAKALAGKYHIPWVADFRDLWSQNQYTYFSLFFMKYFEKNLEINTIKQASAITTVSQPLVEKLAALHENKQIFAIKNGFDPELVNPGNKVDQFFTIVYTGDLYEGKRDPVQLFAVIHELCDKDLIKRDDIKIHFFGYPKLENPENWLQEEIAKHNLQDLVILHGEVSHATAILEQRKAQILLLLTWNIPDEKGVYTGKLFEYLAARRPIISFGYTEGGVVKELLVQTQAGIHAGNYDELKDVIIRAYKEYKKFGMVQYLGINAEVMKYSQKEMARNFGRVLDSVLK